jgi:hypothetical protein
MLKRSMAILIFLAFAGTAQAEWWDTWLTVDLSKTSKTEISGNPGDETSTEEQVEGQWGAREEGTGYSYGALSGVAYVGWRHLKQLPHPCQLGYAAGQLNVVNGKTNQNNRPLKWTTGTLGEKSRTKQLTACKNSPSNNIATERVGFEEPGRFVRALQVCTNQDEDPAKRYIAGLKVWGADVSQGPNAALARKADVEAAVRQTDECTKWHDVVECPTHQIAVGIRGRHDGSVYRGMGLICAPMVNAVAAVDAEGGVLDSSTIPAKGR